MADFSTGDSSLDSDLNSLYGTDDQTNLNAAAAATGDTGSGSTGNLLSAIGSLAGVGLGAYSTVTNASAAAAKQDALNKANQTANQISLLNAANSSKITSFLTSWGGIAIILGIVGILVTILVRRKK